MIVRFFMHQTLVSPLLKKEDLNAHSQSISTHYKSEESSQRYITGKRIHSQPVDRNIAISYFIGKHFLFVFISLFSLLNLHSPVKKVL